MKLRSMVTIALGAALVSASLLAAQEAGKANLRTPAKLTETAPATYKAAFDTSAGKFVVQVNRDWAPKGADRFYNLVKNGFYDDGRFFRVISNFMVQFGINGDAAVHGYCPQNLKVFCITYQELSVTC